MVSPLQAALNIRAHAAMSADPTLSGGVRAFSCCATQRGRSSWGVEGGWVSPNRLVAAVGALDPVREAKGRRGSSHELSRPS